MRKSLNGCNDVTVCFYLSAYRCVSLQFHYSTSKSPGRRSFAEDVTSPRAISGGVWLCARNASEKRTVVVIAKHTQASVLTITKCWNIACPTFWALFEHAEQMRLLHSSQNKEYPLWFNATNSNSRYISTAAYGMARVTEWNIGKNVQG